MSALASVLLLIFSAIGPTSAQDRIIGVASVIDGDTIEIRGSAFAFSASTLPKAASSASGRQAHVGAVDSKQALRWPIGSAAPR